MLSSTLVSSPLQFEMRTKENLKEAERAFINILDNRPLEWLADLDVGKIQEVSSTLLLKRFDVRIDDLPIDR